MLGNYRRFVESCHERSIFWLPSEEADTHLNNFVELCDMKNNKDVDNYIVKLKLFPFSLRDHAKAWFSSLPKNSIDSWNCWGT